MGRTGQNDQRARSNLVMRVPLVPYRWQAVVLRAATAVLPRQHRGGLARRTGRAGSRSLRPQDWRDGADASARECARALPLQVGSAKLSSAGLSTITIKPSVT